MRMEANLSGLAGSYGVVPQYPGAPERIPFSNQGTGFSGFLFRLDSSSHWKNVLSFEKNLFHGFNYFTGTFYHKLTLEAIA
jgi:hypothetical protein